MHCKSMITTETIRERVQGRLAEQRTLVRSMLALREQLQGSLIVRWGDCGKESCACHRGRRHGPYYVLSNRSGGKGTFSYLDRRRANQAKALVARHRAFRRGMRRLQRINEELVALLRRYQEARSRQTGARLRVAQNANV